MCRDLPNINNLEALLNVRDKIGPTVERSRPDFDRTRPIIEFYRSQTELGYGRQCVRHLTLSRGLERVKRGCH